ncbi:MAG: hypothetical protein JO257_15590 [Deltaproteobacteria bacterium]|nr:hypothetical protein [Deltaproteobacteria bacterium]
MRVATIVLLAAVAWPLVRDPLDDGFPLSTYPMFAVARPTTLTMDYALGETRTGERRTLTPGLVGTGEVLQAYALFDRAVHGPREQLQALCTQIAARVARDDDYRDVATIRIVTGRHDAVDYLVRHQIGSEVDRLRCLVLR